MANSYVPLYRKYRPQSFADLVGQEAIVKTISNAFLLHKISHAYLFTGPRGTGKTSTARIFAKSLNCVNGPTVTPCGKCPSCLDIANGNAIDVIEIDAASNRKVEDARNLLEKVQFVPVSGKYKVYIIDEVHMLTTEAFNTLLKTLEEPPQNLVFILATTEAHKVLNTIVSRCQRFDFRRIKNDDILGRLKEICKIENINISENALSLIARRSGGGLRDALSILDQSSVLSSAQEEVTENDVLNLLGSLNLESLIELSSAIADKNSGLLLQILNSIVSQGSEPIQIVRELMFYFRNLLIVKTINKKDDFSQLIDLSEVYFDKLKLQAEQFEILELTQIVEKLAELEKTIKSSSQQYLWLEVGLINICNRNEITLIHNLEDRIAKLEDVINSGNISHQPARPQRIEYNQPVSSNENIKISESPEAKEVNLPVKEEKISVSPSVKDSMQQESSIKTQTEPEKISHQQQALPAGQSKFAGNLVKDWKTLLENIESIPSRMFFSNLAKPVELTDNKITITFNVESFAKQAQEKTKFVPFEKAVKKTLGDLPRIIIRASLPEDKELIKQNMNTGADISASSVPTPSGEEKPQIHKSSENYEQISQNLEEITEEDSLASIDASGSTQCNLDDNACIEEVNREVLPIDISEQAKMIVDLFHGKVIQ